jgi:hypothetical protein
MSFTSNVKGSEARERQAAGAALMQRTAMIAENSVLSNPSPAIWEPIAAKGWRGATELKHFLHAAYLTKYQL